MTAPGCRHGTPLLRYCAECNVESEQLEADFEAGVRNGRWDNQGFAPKDRRAQARTRATMAEIQAGRRVGEAIE